MASAIRTVGISFLSSGSGSEGFAPTEVAGDASGPRFVLVSAQLHKAHDGDAGQHDP